MKMYKAIIAAAFVLGIILTVFIYQAVTIYQLRTQVATDHTTLTQVVDFLNKATQAPTPTPQAVQQAPAPTKK